VSPGSIRSLISQPFERDAANDPARYAYVNFAPFVKGGKA
jgi:hypothetical protein